MTTTPELPESADAELDTLGLTCPEPLMLLRHRMRELPAGAVLRVLANDPTTDRDFRNYCRFVGHELLLASTNGDQLEFWLRKQS